MKPPKGLTSKNRPGWMGQMMESDLLAMMETEPLGMMVSDLLEMME